MQRVLMPASGHQSDEYDSVHVLLDNGRIPCGRVFAANLHTTTDKSITCQRCKKALERRLVGN